MRTLVHLLAPLGVACLNSETHGESSLTANPIRRVVTMLQAMQQKVTEEGKREEELYDKFMCFCKTGAGDLSASIAAAEQKTTADTSSLEAAEASKLQLGQELGDHQADRSEAQDAVAQAKAMRAKEAAVFAKDDADYQTNIAALGKAIGAIEKGMSGSFLQSAAASRLRELTVSMDLGTADRDMLSAFLSEGQGYAPKSGDITGILKQMEDSMVKDKGDIVSTETKAKADFEALVGAKEKEIEANSKAIESKTERLGQVGVDIVNLREDLDDTTKAMLEDKSFLQNLDKDCSTKTGEWEVRSKLRAEEVVALADTIKILNDDDALDLFKKSLPSASLLQTKVSAKSVRHQALKQLRNAGHSVHRDTRLDMVMLALTGKSQNFDKVLKMIDDMVTLLGAEQTDDDSKKVYCESMLDKTEDEKKELDHTYDDLQKAIAEAEETITTMAEEIKALEAGIIALDKSVSEATEMRQSENAEYKETMQADQAAKELIGVAQNRLAKFYNPKLYKAAPKRELSAEDRIAVNMGGTPPPTEAPGGIAGTGVAVLAQVSAHTQRRGADGEAPPPPPETWGAYQTKGQEQNGVVAMLDLLVADLDKEMQEMEVEETDAQKDYQKYVADSADKRAIDGSSIEEKESAKADAEAGLEKATMDNKSKMVESYNTAMVLKDLHLECDWLVSNFEIRKEARAGEIDSLKKGKAILSGADFA